MQLYVLTDSYNHSMVVYLHSDPLALGVQALHLVMGTSPAA